MVLNHIQLIVSSLPEAKKFYLAALAPLGYKEYYAVEGVVVGLADANGAPDLWLGPVKGPEDSPTKGLHLAFTAHSREVVDQFHAAALYVCRRSFEGLTYSIVFNLCRKEGAKDNGAPGVRNYVPGYYAAYVLDLEGNNIEVVHV